MRAVLWDAGLRLPPGQRLERPGLLVRPGHPVLAYLLASARMSGPLDQLRAWLVDNNNAIMAVLLLVLGVAMIGKGISAF